MDADLGGAVDRLLKLNRALRESPGDETLRALIDALDRFVSRPELRPGLTARARSGLRSIARGRSSPSASR